MRPALGIASLRQLVTASRFVGWCRHLCSRDEGITYHLDISNLKNGGSKSRNMKEASMKKSIWLQLMMAILFCNSPLVALGDVYTVFPPITGVATNQWVEVGPPAIVDPDSLAVGLGFQAPLGTSWYRIGHDSNLQYSCSLDLGTTWTSWMDFTNVVSKALNFQQDPLADPLTYLPFNYLVKFRVLSASTPGTTETGTVFADVGNREWAFVGVGNQEWGSYYPVYHYTFSVTTATGTPTQPSGLTSVPVMEGMWLLPGVLAGLGIFAVRRKE